MIILKENLVDALKIAIYYKQLYEQTVLKYAGDSAQVAGWKEVLEHLIKNGQPKIEL
jgi:hypothetical protein